MRASAGKRSSMMGATRMALAGDAPFDHEQTIENVAGKIPVWGPADGVGGGQATARETVRPGVSFLHLRDIESGILNGGWSYSKR